MQNRFTRNQFKRNLQCFCLTIFLVLWDVLLTCYFISCMTMNESKTAPKCKQNGFSNNNSVIPDGHNPLPHSGLENGAPFQSMEITKDLPTHVLPDCFLMIQNTIRSSNHNIAPLQRKSDQINRICISDTMLTTCEMYAPDLKLNWTDKDPRDKYRFIYTPTQLHSTLYGNRWGKSEWSML